MAQRRTSVRTAGVRRRAGPGEAGPIDGCLAMLSLNNIEVVYDGVILVLKGVSLTAEEGRITTLLGANGAGKTTTLKAISGLLRNERGEVTKGTSNSMASGSIACRRTMSSRRGIAQVFEGRRVFENLTVEENLIAGAHTRRDFGRVRAAIDGVFDTFPSAQGASPSVLRLSFGRRAADAGDRPRADVRAQGDTARRALARPGADAGRPRSSASFAACATSAD